MDFLVISLGFIKSCHTFLCVFHFDCVERIWCRIAYIDPQSFGLFALILKSLAAQKMMRL